MKYSEHSISSETCTVRFGKKERHYKIWGIIESSCTILYNTWFYLCVISRTVERRLCDIQHT